MFIEMELYLGSLHEWVHCMSKIPCCPVVLKIIYNGSLHSITHSFAIRSLLWLKWFLKSPQSLLNVPTQMDNRTVKSKRSTVAIQIHKEISKFKHKRLSLVPQILTVNQVVDHKNLLLCQGVNLLWHAHVDRRCHCIRPSGGFTISRRCGHCFVAATASYTANTSRWRWCGWHGWWGASCLCVWCIRWGSLSAFRRTPKMFSDHLNIFHNTILS